MTKLEAINDILTAVGEAPALTLVAGAADTTAAETVLNSVCRKVLSKGLECNTDHEYELQPDVDGRIAVPADALFIDPSDKTLDYVQREGYIYDRKNHTNVIGKPVKFTIYRNLDFEDLPYHVQREIVAQAAHQYQAAYVGSPALAAGTVDELIDAKGAAADLEGETDDESVLDNPYVFGRFYRRRYRGWL